MTHEWQSARFRACWRPGRCCLLTPTRRAPATLVIVTLLVALAFIGSAGASLLLQPAPAKQLVVGHHGTVPHALFAGHDVRVLKSSVALKFVVVSAPDPVTFTAAALANPLVSYVETNGDVRHSGASWDGSSWDGASWDGASWNGASWDGASWNGATWDGASWNGATWDGASWNSATWNGASWNGEELPDPGYAYQWGLGAVNAPSAWARTNGGGHAATICVVDSGVDYTHPDLAANVRFNDDGTAGFDFVTGTPDGMDVAGHGTHVAGIAAGVTANREGTSGLAQALILPARVLDADGVGKEADLALAIEWCTDEGADVISMSLGTPERKKFLKDAVTYAAAKGAFLTAAAGNDGCRCVQYPAAYAEVLGVAAFTRDGTIAGFSNTGPGAGIAAPGVHVAGPFPGGEYRLGSGTSQATPFVAGAAALLLAADPALSNADVAIALEQSARGETPADAWGRGSLNVDAALDVALG